MSQLNNNDEQKLADLLITFKNATPLLMGYPINTDFDYSRLFEFLNYSINNAGDPYHSNACNKLNSHSFEQEVIDFFAKLLNAPNNNYWGYVTNGGTEGNLYALYLARELYPTARVYYSSDSHYSIAKILRLLRLDNSLIASQASGEMDYKDLANKLAHYKHNPAIIIANIGTTMKGAIDSIKTIKAILNNHAIEHFIHADAALFGLLLPFIANSPAFAFDAGIDSISISGHKLIGSPVPCGVVLTKKNYSRLISTEIDYIAGFDATISGSRNGITPLFLWYAIKTKGLAGFSSMAKHCLQVADYAVLQLNAIGIKAWKNEYSIIVLFDYHDKRVLAKWQIAVQENLAHLITMPSISKARIDDLIADITGVTRSSDFLYANS
jgi:histidine decarboxylase